MSIHPTLCYYCGIRPGIKTDSKARLVCKTCIYGLPVVVQQTPSRNDFCPCGSGKKYKRCCRKVIVT